MSNEIIIAIIGIAAALIGTIIGGAVSYFSNKSINTLEWQRRIKNDEVTERKDIYSSFLKYSYKLRVDAIRQSQIEHPSGFNDLTFVYSQIELIASQPVTDSACKLYTHVVKSHNAGNDTTEDEYAQLKGQFIYAVKNELAKLQNT